MLTQRATQNKQKLDWRKSIVDLMKLLDLDSSLNAKELAKELGYSGDTDYSAAMNVWLHKQVMTKLAASGGKGAGRAQDISSAPSFYRKRRARQSRDGLLLGCLAAKRTLILALARQCLTPIGLPPPSLARARRAYG